MRRTFYVLVTLLWLIASSGFSITAHYCGGKFVEMCVNSSPKPCCDTPGCCNNVTKAYQLDEDIILIKNQQSDPYPVMDILFYENNYITLNREESMASIHLDIPPIPPPKLPVLLATFQSFLI